MKGNRSVLIDQLRELQGDRCGICGLAGRKGLHVDHDHETGLIRGLLCVGCNLKEGQHSYGCELDECGVCQWRRQPAVSWLGWTISYDGAPPLTDWTHFAYQPAERLAVAIEAHRRAGRRSLDRIIEDALIGGAS